MRRWLIRIVSSILLCTGLWTAGLGWFVMRIPASPAEMTGDPGDLIVVLTGGPGRLEHGLRLLAQGKGKALLITGTGKKVTLADIVRQTPPDAQEAIRRIFPGKIILGREAENTIGNAEETARLLGETQYHGIRLVTSAYHMPRSVSEFSRELPLMALRPDPVFSAEFPADGWWRRTESRKLVLSEYHKYVAGKLRHMLMMVRS